MQGAAPGQHPEGRLESGPARRQSGTGTSGWTYRSTSEPENAFKVQWEQFLRHVALDEPWRFTLREAAKGVQLAELGLKSAREKCWVDVPELGQ